jgi:hypothetical protein
MIHSPSAPTEKGPFSLATINIRTAQKNKPKSDVFFNSEFARRLMAGSDHYVQACVGHPFLKFNDDSKKAAARSIKEHGTIVATTRTVCKVATPQFRN